MTPELPHDVLSHILELAAADPENGRLDVRGLSRVARVSRTWRAVTETMLSGARRLQMHIDYKPAHRPALARYAAFFAPQDDDPPASRSLRIACPTEESALALASDMSVLPRDVDALCLVATGPPAALGRLVDSANRLRVQGLFLELEVPAAAPGEAACDLDVAAGTRTLKICVTDRRPEGRRTRIAIRGTGRRAALWVKFAGRVRGLFVCRYATYETLHLEHAGPEIVYTTDASVHRTERAVFMHNVFLNDRLGKHLHAESLLLGHMFDPVNVPFPGANLERAAFIDGRTACELISGGWLNQGFNPALRLTFEPDGAETALLALTA